MYQNLPKFQKLQKHSYAKRGSVIIFFLDVVLNVTGTDIKHELSINPPKTIFFKSQKYTPKNLNTKSNLSPQPPLVGDGGSGYRL